MLGLMSVFFPEAPAKISPILSDTEDAFLWNVPGSKSITNRALVLAALANGTSTLYGALHSDDTRHMRVALEQLGITIEDVDATTWRVEGGVDKLCAPSEKIFVGNSGTTVRFLTALCALVPGEVTLVGDEHMAKRPIGDLIGGLDQLGVEVVCASGCPPLTIKGDSLQGGKATMEGSRSSQYFSALMMASVGARDAVEIEVSGDLVSRPYVDITLKMLESFGGGYEEVDGRFVIYPSELVACEYDIEPDASAASYAFAFGVISNIPVEVPGITRDALQGDVEFLSVLEQVGAGISYHENSTRVEKGSLGGVTVDMHHISDTVMTLAAIAPLLEGKTRIENVANIRIKETDRLEATVNELNRLGQVVEFGEDWLEIEPRPIKGDVVRSYADHRMAMAFSILGLAQEGVSIEEPSCVAKTYPTFWEDLERLYEFAGASSPWRDKD